MIPIKPICAAAALAIAATGIGVSTPAQAGVVVKSSGPSASEFPVGRKLPDDSSITLRQGDRVTVLTSTGTRVITGPGTHRVGGRGTSKRSVFAILTRQRAGTRVRTGAVRGENGVSEAVNPNLWNLDVTQGGRMCLANPSLINLWRPDPSREATYIFGSSVSSFHVHVTFDEGVSQASLTGEELPLSQNQSYSISSADGSPATPVEFVVLAEVPETPEDMASTLAENGCSAQLDLLSDRLMARE